MTVIRAQLTNDDLANLYQLMVSNNVKPKDRGKYRIELWSIENLPEQVDRIHLLHFNFYFVGDEKNDSD